MRPLFAALAFALAFATNALAEESKINVGAIDFGQPKALGDLLG